MTNARKNVSFSVEFGNGYQEDIISSYIDVGHGQTILFIHGFFSDSRDWLPLINLLQESYRCISIDLLGFAGSSKPNIDYYVIDQVKYIKTFIDVLELKDFIIFGHSLGAWIAGSYAIYCDSSLAGLTLIAPAGIEQVLIQYQIFRPLYWKSKWVDKVLDFIAILFSTLGAKEFINQIKIIRKEMLLNPMFRTWMYRALKLQKTRELIVDSIHKIHCPSLILVGSKDNFTPLWQCKKFNEKIPVSNLIIIRNSGHTLPTDDPSAIHEHFVAYFQGVEQCIA